jgi:P-type Ca2+ transporter type 2C
VPRRATVLRDGELREIDGEEVVRGDVVWLESGNRVAADLRLLTDQGLEIDESLLTGESAPVLKDAHWTGDEATPMADRINMAFAGSICTHGRGKGVVVATGPATAVGQLALDVLASPGGKTSSCSSTFCLGNILTKFFLNNNRIMG